MIVALAVGSVGVAGAGLTDLGRRSGLPIRAVHITELRWFVVALE